jgi:pSer/pThr/pTyr-binding forkhead associated (FHA) protein
VPEQLLNLLKLFLLVLLYLFFFRVLRAVWTEVNARPAEAAAAPVGRPQRQPRRPARPGRSTPQLRLLEGAGPKGRSYPLVDELTLGRASGCQVTIDDSYCSQVHARIFPRDGTWYVEDLGSTNGTYLNRRRVAGPMVMKKRDRLQIGNTVLEMV